MNAVPSRRRPIPLPRQYSAEIVRSDDDSNTKVYIDGNKRRTETTVSGSTTIAISRPDLREMYNIELEVGTYFTIPLTPEMEASIEMDIEEEIEWEYVATEKLGSHTVEVYDVFGKDETCRRSRLWVDRATHIRWKEITFNKYGTEVLTSESRNVRIGPPPASVFDVPPGLREIRLGRK